MAAKHKNNANTETHQSIERQIAAFLKAGNKIQQIPSGVSGLPSLAAAKKSS